MKIALDAMGGDFGQPNLVAGAVMALREYRQINKLYLVGDPAKIPLRALTPDLLKQDVAFVSARPVQQRIEGQGGWANGDAVFVGDNPPESAVINYYQRERHLFGKMKLELLDLSGRVVDQLPASKRT